MIVLQYFRACFAIGQFTTGAVVQSWDFGPLCPYGLSYAKSVMSVLACANQHTDGYLFLRDGLASISLSDRGDSVEGGGDRPRDSAVHTLVQLQNSVI